MWPGDWVQKTDGGCDPKRVWYIETATEQPAFSGRSGLQPIRFAPWRVFGAGVMPAPEFLYGQPGMAARVKSVMAISARRLHRRKNHFAEVHFAAF